MAKKPTVPKIEGRDRRQPKLRERCQIGYDLLRELLKRAGRNDVLEQLAGLDTVDDVLRHQPAFVPLLLKAAWELRNEAKFADLFLNAETGAPVQERDEPIAPCGRTFDEVVQAHLYGAARLYFERLEKDWAAARAREEERRWRQRRERRKRAGLIGRLTVALQHAFGKLPAFDPESYRREYEGYGLYTAIKPYLRHEWQFRLIPLYARMSTRQARAFDELLLYFRVPQELDVALRLRSQDISVARGYARAFAEARTGVSLAAVDRRPGAHETAENIAGRRAEAEQEERRAFDLLLTRYVDCLEALKTFGAGAEGTVRRLTPVFGDEVWTLFRDRRQLDNAVNCPEHIMAVIGPSCRVLPPEVAAIFNQIQDRNLTHDLLQLALEHFPREEFERYLADPTRLPVWNQLPAKFNNNYHYQADAPSDSATVKNHDNLRMVCVGIFKSLRSADTGAPVS